MRAGQAAARRPLPPVSCLSCGLRDHLALDWDPPGIGDARGSSSPGGSAAALLTSKGSCAPAAPSSPPGLGHGGLGPFFPLGFAQSHQIPLSDQGALAALMIAVNEASQTWPIITELAMSFGQTPAPAAGVGRVGLRLSPELINE